MQHYTFSRECWFVNTPDRIPGKGPGLPVETAYFRISITVKGKTVTPREFSERYRNGRQGE
jgi:hypothetical protein